jgi:hypothetical protein
MDSVCVSVCVSVSMSVCVSVCLCAHACILKTGTEAYRGDWGHMWNQDSLFPVPGQYRQQLRAYRRYGNIAPETAEIWGLHGTWRESTDQSSWIFKAMGLQLTWWSGGTACFPVWRRKLPWLSQHIPYWAFSDEEGKVSVPTVPLPGKVQDGEVLGRTSSQGEAIGPLVFRRTKSPPAPQPAPGIFSPRPALAVW